VSISGPGSLALDATTVSSTTPSGRSLSATGAVGSASKYYVNVFSDGTAGVATVVISSGTTVLSTKTVSFAGPATTLAVALNATTEPTWISSASGTTTIKITAKDAAGIAADLPASLKVASGTTTVATVGSITQSGASGTFVITGVAAGTSVITVSDPATTSPAASATYSVTVKAATTTAAATLTFDKAEYNPGELMTITIAADVADNAAYVAFTAAPVASANLITVKNPFASGTTGTVALVAGKATWTAYAPLSSGPLTLTATSSAGPTTAVTVTATAGVTNEALDAASEAIDAANAATDAANAAAEAADAATAAAQDAADQVAALSTSVSAMITALKKQITALTNLVIKIQKKVKA
jgi:hypothetical protein